MDVKFDKKDVRHAIENAISKQAARVEAMDITDPEYEKQLANLIALQDALDRRKPKIDWLGWFKAVGDVALGTGALLGAAASVAISFKSADEMRMCDGRIFNLKNDFMRVKD